MLSIDLIMAFIDSSIAFSWYFDNRESCYSHLGRKLSEVTKSEWIYQQIIIRLRYFQPKDPGKKDQTNKQNHVAKSFDKAKLYLYQNYNFKIGHCKQ